MRALWAVNPFHMSSKQLRSAHSLISSFVSDDKIDVGYVVTQTETELNLAFDVPKEERHTVYPRRILEEKLKQARLKIKSAQVHVVNFPTFSQTSAVKRFLQLGRDRKSDITVIFSQGGSELRKLFLGSFAETAVHFSESKLLVLNPHSKTPKKIRTVLFCADAGESSLKALSEIASFCKAAKAKLVVLHVAQFNFNTPDEKADPSAKAYKKTVELLESRVQKVGESEKIDCKFVVSTDFSMISDIAVSTSKKVRADVIAVVAKSGSKMALIGGSVTRQILRRSKIPVMVLR